MFTVRLPTVRVLWPPLDVSTSRGLGPQVDKFEQVFSDDHQMSVVGEVDRYPGSMSGERVGRVRSNVSWVMVSQTDTCLWKHYHALTSFASGKNSAFQPIHTKQKGIFPLRFAVFFFDLFPFRLHFYSLVKRVWSNNLFQSNLSPVITQSSSHKCLIEFFTIGRYKNNLAKYSIIWWIWEIWLIV